MRFPFDQLEHHEKIRRAAQRLNSSDRAAHPSRQARPSGKRAGDLRLLSPSSIEPAYPEDQTDHVRIRLLSALSDDRAAESPADYDELNDLPVNARTQRQGAMANAGIANPDRFASPDTDHDNLFMRIRLTEISKSSVVDMTRVTEPFQLTFDLTKECIRISLASKAWTGLLQATIGRLMRLAELVSQIFKCMCTANS